MYVHWPIFWAVLAVCENVWNRVVLMYIDQINGKLSMILNELCLLNRSQEVLLLWRLWKTFETLVDVQATTWLG